MRDCPGHRSAAIAAVEGTALEAALELTGAIAASAPLSVRAGKEMIDAAPRWAPEEGFARQSELAGPVLLPDDAREGVAAFAERRAPVRSGR